MTAKLNPAERRTVAGMAGVVIGLHLIGFFILIVLVAPHHYRLGASGGFSIGLGLTATRSGCATRSTPITSRRSTTPRAS